MIKNVRCCQIAQCAPKAGRDVRFALKSRYRWLDLLLPESAQKATLTTRARFPLAERLSAGGNQSKNGLHMDSRFP
jgi:hypothetical protein